MLPSFQPRHAERCTLWMGWVMSCGFLEDKEILIQSSCAGGTNSWEASHPLHCNSRKIIGSFMCSKEWGGKEITLYYLSRTLVGAELKYSPIEKIYLLLTFAIQKLRHYMQAYMVPVISKADPIKYIPSRPILNGRLAKWPVILKQYNLICVPQRAVEGQVLVDFLAITQFPTIGS